MKEALRHALCELDTMERTARMHSPLHRVDGRAKLLVTALFLATMLSVPLSRLSELLLYFLYPILTASMGSISFAGVFRRSLVVLPFVVFIGIFNVFYDRTPAFRIASVTVSEGWVSLLSIVVRGLLSVEALILLVYSTGFYGVCRNLQRLGLPSLFTAQLLFVYRYTYVLIEEAEAMRLARDARSFGRRAYPLRIWGQFVGQLLIRTFDRAERVNRAMLARGFTGRLPDSRTGRSRWTLHDTLYLALWAAACLLARTLYPVETLSHLFR